MFRRNQTIFSAVAVITLIRVVSPTLADPGDGAGIIRRLKDAYPDDVAGGDSQFLVFKDGTRLPLVDGQADKPFDAWLAHPDIEDMFRLPYPRDSLPVPPSVNSDPGRARNKDFFTKIYGDCRKPGFAESLTTIVWLPRRSGQRITISRKNDVAKHLQAVSDELDSLPRKFDAYLIPSAGGFMCRTIAGTDQRSAHGYGIAIDIATKHSDYWRWTKGGPRERPIYHNEIPAEIVHVFEKHGFIWGGRWYHYDTMHFEYRPELIAPEK